MSNLTILITGANRGIGLELTRQFSEDGWQVLACCRSPEDADALKVLASEYPTLEMFQLDVTNYDQLAALSSQLKDRPIDILLSNAGIYGPRGDAFGKVDAAAWRQVFEVNTIAPLMLAQAFIEQVAISRQKVVAVISSKMGSIADNSSGGSYIYRSSKTALNQVVKSIAKDVEGRDISAISLHPGWVRTEMGGPNAEIDVNESAAGLKQVLTGAGLAQSGQFFNFDGSVIPW